MPLLAILIPFLWLALVFIGMAMFRLAALSDDSHTAELAAWLSEQQPVREERPADSAPFDAQRGAYRAAG